MKTRLLVLLASVFLIVLAWMADIPVFAQQQGAPPPGGRAGAGGFRRGGGRANTPTFPGPPAGMQALPIDLFL
jgi:hypothetical protein